jgi:hypothetical protein
MLDTMSLLGIGTMPYEQAVSSIHYPLLTIVTKYHILEEE